MAAALFDRPGFGPDALMAEVVSGTTAAQRGRTAQVVFEKLDPGASDAILEVGFGSGRLLAELAARARRGFVAGVDPSERMYRHALHRNRRAVADGRLELRQGESADLSIFAESRFDKAVAVDVIYFWTRPARDLEELRRVLRPGGELLLGFRPPGRSTSRVAFAPERAASLLRELGFEDVRVTHEPGERAGTWIQARRGSAPRPA